MKIIKKKNKMNNETLKIILNSLRLSERISGRTIEEHDIKFSDDFTATLITEYPFQSEHETKIQFRSLQQLIRKVRQSMRYMYKNNKCFGVCNHEIGDLWLERFDVKAIDGELVIIPIIGS